jgi:ankyrin repeat protein
MGNTILSRSLLGVVVPLTVVTGNLYHIPGLSRTASKEDYNNVHQDLYLVCSVAEDDTREDVMYEIEKGADINWISPDEGMTCLLSAVMRGKLDVVETMLEQGADVTISRVHDGMTVLEAASKYGRTHEMMTLQKHGHLLDVNQSLHGIPLIHWACEGFSVQHKRVLSFLVDQGADINQVDWLGRTCLDKAFRRNLMFHIEDLGGKKSKDLLVQAS